MSGHINFSLGEKLSVLDDGTWKNVSVNERLEDGINVSDNLGRKSFYSESVLRRKFGQGHLQRCNLPANLSPSKKKQAAASICALPLSEQAEARRWAAYAMRWVRDGKRGGSSEKYLKKIISAVSKEINDPKPPNWRTFSDKLRLMRDGVFDARLMIGNPRGRGNRSARFGEFEPIMMSIIRDKALTPRPSTIDAITAVLKTALQNWNAVQEEQCQIKHTLSRRTVERRVRQISDYDKTCAREGENEAAAEQLPSGKPNPARFPMENVEIDHTSCGVVAVHPKSRKPIGIPIFTAVVDRYSSLPVGWHLGFEEAGYRTVSLALRNTILPKDEMLEFFGLDPDALPYSGIPLSATFDNGPEFKSADLDNALSQFSIDKSWGRIAKGSDKPEVEAFNKLIKAALFNTWPGSKPKGKREGHTAHYNPKKEAALTIAEMRQLIAAYLVNEFSKKEKRSGYSRYQKFVEGTVKHPVRMPSHVSDVAVFLLPVQTRKLQREGIQMNNTYYGRYHEELAALLLDDDRPETCIIKWDQSNIGSIWLLDWRTRTYLRLDADPDVGFAGKDIREYEMDREIALAEKRVRESLSSEDIRRATVKRLELTNQMIVNGKGEGRKFARAARADPEFSSKMNDTPAVEIIRPSDKEARPRSRRGSDFEIQFDRNPL